MRALLWMGGIPAAGALLVYAVDAARDDHSGDPFWRTALLVCGLVGATVAWLAYRSGYAARDAFLRAFVAASATLAFVWLPIVVSLANCDGGCFR